MKYNIELDCEVGSKLVAAMLHDDLEMLKTDLEKLKTGETFFHNFSSDLKIEQKELKKHIKALRLILEYYGEADVVKTEQPIMSWDSIYEELERELPA